MSETPGNLIREFTDNGYRVLSLLSSPSPTLQLIFLSHFISGLLEHDND